MIALILVALQFSGAAGSVAPAKPGDLSPNTVSPVVVQKTATNDVADMDKVICKTFAVAGTRIPSRVCGTKHDWAEREREAHEAVQYTQETALKLPIHAGG